MATEKKKVSAFEFAIMQISDPDGAQNYEPYTEAEQLQRRRDAIEHTLNQLRIKHPGQEDRRLALDEIIEIQNRLIPPNR